MTGTQEWQIAFRKGQLVEFGFGIAVPVSLLMAFIGVFDWVSVVAVYFSPIIIGEIYEAFAYVKALKGKK